MATELAWKVFHLVRRVVAMIPPAMVMILIGLDLLALFKAFIIPKFSSYPVSISLMLILLIPTLVLMITSYLRCIAANCSIPLDSQSQAAIRGRLDSEYCRRCKAWRLPRAHHCSVCQNCTALMDHHCVWVGNCVGEANYKFFVLFLIYAVIGCYIALIGLIGKMYDYLMMESSQAPDMMVVIPTVLTCSFALSLSCFVGFHLRLIFTGQTTLEHNLRLRRSSEEFRRTASSREKWCVIFGDDPRLWFLPVSNIVPLKERLHAEVQEDGEEIPLVGLEGVLVSTSGQPGAVEDVDQPFMDSLVRLI